MSYRKVSIAMKQLFISPIDYAGIWFVVPEKRFELLSDRDKKEYNIQAKVKQKKKKNGTSKKK